MLNRPTLIGLCLPLFCLLAASCGEAEPERNKAAEPRAPASVPASVPASAPGPAAPAPPEPGTPAGLADDKGPVSEAPFGQDSAQGAAQILQTYFALIEAGKYDEAWKLRWKGEGDNEASRAAFADSFERYAEYHANIGAPGRISGAAGSLYVEVPVQTYGRTRDGKSFSNAGTVTLRRANDVPGSTREQRSWRIYSGD